MLPKKTTNYFYHVFLFTWPRALSSVFLLSGTYKMDANFSVFVVLPESTIAVVAFPVSTSRTVAEELLLAVSDCCKGLG